ncbi:VOC family protein [Streptomyces sp. H27-C3]|uniref:VOC family protein n=1 Tax=Streptomyces sp. H27-C3 TaxID=3046305 RepID=UPI0024BAA566|nr:VOC family protein [Streptomyces sp. H27-C3]MDJ0463261.1 VOC family protein [Streptomyces sp. H27-C3]
MSLVSSNQPYGTPTWIELDVPATGLDRAREFYGALFGWDFTTADAANGFYTTCLLRDLPVAGLRQAATPAAPGLWCVYFATEDCDSTAKRVADAGGTVRLSPLDVPGLGRRALAEDPVGAHFGLWQGGTHPGCRLVNEPGTLVRNDLITANPEPARLFYADVFDFTLDGNQDLPESDFTFLRRPDGHEIGGVFGDPTATSTRWQTTFEVADTDATVASALAAGGSAGPVSDTPYGRMAEITDPLGNVFDLIARPAGTILA